MDQSLEGYEHFRQIFEFIGDCIAEGPGATVSTTVRVTRKGVTCEGRTSLGKCTVTLEFAGASDED
jgi:hypothetical protein